jgi:pimeloyl-ACP methyl ester carboxylesterase
MRLFLRVVFFSFCLFGLFAQGARASEPGYVRKIPGSSAVIVFVHGIFGDARETWTNSGPSKSFFPDLVADDPQFKNVDIYAYEYPTSFLNGPFSIDEIAENMRLFFDNDGVSSHQNLIFISHSMGGLATRAYLLKNRDAAARTRLVYFYSTPTTGSEIAAIASLASSNPQLAKMKPMKSADYLADLQRQWLAADLKIPSYCAYETQKTYGVSVVTQASASNLCTKRLDPINADHLSIVKPANNRDVPYIAFKSAYVQTISDAMTAPAPGQLRRADAELSQEQMEALQGPLDSDDMYSAFVLVTIINKDDRVKELDMLETFDTASARLAGKEDSVSASLGSCKPSKQEIACLLLLQFDGQPPNGAKLALSIGPLVIEHPVSDTAFRWEKRQYDKRRPWHVSTSEVRYEVDKIDWLVLSNAEILAGTGSLSLLRFTVTNLTGQTKSVRQLNVYAKKPFKSGSRCNTGDRAETITLNWQKVVSGKPGAAAIDVAGVTVPVEVLYNYIGKCSGGYSLSASVPISESIEASTTKQILIRIDEMPATPNSARRDPRGVEPAMASSLNTPPNRLASWPYLTIGLKADATDIVRPEKLTLTSPPRPGTE